MQVWTRIMAALALVIAGAGSTPAAPQALPELTGVVLLTVEGLDQARFPDGQLQLDLARMQALGEETIETSTIWTEGVHRYTGLPLVKLTEFLGLEGGMFRAKALNDYSVELPIADAVEGGPILAYLEDGQPMPVRDKGPIWLVYPFDSNADYRSEVTYTRSIWQLESLEVLP